MAKATYCLVFSVAREGTGTAGGHQVHSSWAHRRDAERELAQLAAADPDCDYQICEFSADVPESVARQIARQAADVTDG